MFQSRTIYEEIMISINDRADLGQYLLDLGKMPFGLRPAIKVDKSLRNIFEAFEIPFPTGGNPQVFRLLKRDGVFENVEHYEDSEYSSVNTLFYTLESFWTFTENFSNWLEENAKNKPSVVEMESKIED